MRSILRWGLHLADGELPKTFWHSVVEVAPWDAAGPVAGDAGRRHPTPAVAGAAPRPSGPPTPLLMEPVAGTPPRKRRRATSPYTRGCGGSDAAQRLAHPLADEAAARTPVTTSATQTTFTMGLSVEEALANWTAFCKGDLAKFPACGGASTVQLIT